MEDKFYIRRTLQTDKRLYSEKELLNASKYIVILAEPGAGKTYLMESLATQLNTELQTATRFYRNKSVPNNSPLIIDAFDELSKLSSEGIYTLLESAFQASPTHLIISSRSSEWAQSETLAFGEYFIQDPLVVRLTEFSVQEQQQIFEHHIPNENFSLFQNEIARFDLTALLPNPQFLTLFADAYLESNRRFSNKYSIFSQALERLAKEANPKVKPYSTPLSVTQKIKLVSEVFTKLLLSGSEGISINEALSDRNYPMLSSLGNTLARANLILATRLFKPGYINDTHRPVHKIVAEYSAATYLVSRINDENDHVTLDKCLAVIAPGSVVRDELRGLVGWMACIGTDKIQQQLITLDPYAVLANGDPSQLLPAGKRLLIDRLRETEQKDPYFRREDFWRNLNVTGFFTADIIDEIRPLLTQNSDGHLTGLLLELLIGSPIVESLIDPLRKLVLSEQDYPRTRRLALDCLLGMSGNIYNPRNDMAVLIFIASVESLKLVAEAIKYHSPLTFNIKYITGFLRVCSHLYPTDQNISSNVIGERYFVKLLVACFDLKTTESVLDTLTQELECTCGQKFYSCECRIGISKITSILLDRYFELKKAPFDYAKIWGWMYQLNFYGQARFEQCKTLAVFKNHPDIKQGIIYHAFSQQTESESIIKMTRAQFGFHGHSALTLNTEDYKYIIDLAYKTENKVLWSAFIQQHIYRTSNEYKGTNKLRRHMREQANKNLELMRLWASANRSAAKQDVILKKTDFKSNRSYKRHLKRQQEKHKENIQYVRQNRELIESGRHWNLLKRFAELTLIKPDNIEEEFGEKSIVSSDLYNCLPVIYPDLPSLSEIAQARCQSQYFEIIRVLHASCLERVRKDGNLDSVPIEALYALKTDMSDFYQGVTEDESNHLNEEINRIALSNKIKVELYCRDYIEPQLSYTTYGHPDIYNFCRGDVFRDVAPHLALEWLEKYPDMVKHALDSIFNTAAKYCNRELVDKLISKKCLEVFDTPGPEQPDQNQEELRTFWSIRACYFLNEAEGVHWDWISSNKEYLLLFNKNSSRFHIQDDASWPRLSAKKIEAIINAYFTQWPKVELPSSYGSDDPKEETAYRFLTEIIRSIPLDLPETAMTVLKRLLENPTYADLHNDMKSMLAGVERKQAHRNFHPPAPIDIVRLLDEDGIVTVEGLRAHVIQQLRDYQKEIDGGEFNPVRRFYQDYKKPETYLREVPATEIVAEYLRLSLGRQFTVSIEAQTKAANRIDITVSKNINNHRKLLVIEAKGQWHSKIYTAAKTQLHDRYAIHPEAANQGIYLVFWYGSNVLINNRKQHEISTAEEFKEKIKKEMPDSLHGSIDVFVLDLSNPL